MIKITKLNTNKTNSLCLNQYSVSQLHKVRLSKLFSDFKIKALPLQRFQSSCLIQAAHMISVMLKLPRHLKELQLVQLRVELQVAFSGYWQGLARWQFPASVHS